MKKDGGRPASAAALVAAREAAGELDLALREARSWTAAAPREAAAHLAVARLAWRVGRAREARRALGRASAALAKATTSVAHVEAELLSATLDAEAGRMPKARRSLEVARTLAEDLGDDPLLARVLARLGTLEARRGRATVAGASYRAALRTLGEGDPRLRAAWLANLATMESWLGRYDEAEAGYRLALRLRKGDVTGRLNTEAALAALALARGGRAAAPGFAPLAARAAAVGDRRLIAELSAYLAEEAVDRGELAAAGRAIDAARVALAELGGAEVLLDALVDVADARLAAARGDPAALDAFPAPLAALRGAGAAYFEARGARLAAASAVALGDDDAVPRWIARVARLVDPTRLRLGAEADHVVPYTLAALSGDAVAARHAASCLARVGRARVRAELAAAGREDLVARLDRERPAPRPRGATHRCDGPEGVRWLTAQGKRALVADETTVVLDRELGLLVVRGKPRPLGRRRMLAPLLAHLATRAPHACSTDELAAAVWGVRPSRSTYDAIKATVARARVFLGARAHLVTTHRRPDGELAYALSPSLPFFVVDRVT